MPRPFDFDLGDLGRVQRKLPLDAFAAHDPPHDERLRVPDPARAMTTPLKIWMRSFSPSRIRRVYVDGVANLELGHLGLEAALFN